MREQRGVGTEPHTRPNHDVSANVGSLADRRCWVDNSSAMNAGRVGRGLIEKAQRTGEGQIGVLDAQSGGGNLLKFRLNQDRRGFGGARETRISGIGHEGYLRGPGILNPFHTSYFQLRVPAEFRAQPACQFA
jgi:hypothetical protein